MKNKLNRNFSIKRRLIGSILTALVLFLSIAISVTYLFARHEIEEVYDAHLSQSAKMLQNFMLNLTSDGAHKDNMLYSAWSDAIVSARQTKFDRTYASHPYEENFLFQIYQSGMLIWESNPNHLEVTHNPDFEGFSNIQINNATWRVFQLPILSSISEETTHSHHYILVAENNTIRDEITNEIALSSAIPLMLLIPLLLLLIILLIDKNLSPLNTLKIAISQRHANKLDHIYISSPSDELTPLINTLNQLLTELDQARAREKRFTLMAAHELKTPLTILRLNAQNAIESQTKADLSSALDNILKGIDRTNRLIQQLLMLAKIEQLKYLSKQEIDLAIIITTEIADLAPFALRQYQELSFEGHSTFLQADELLMPVLFRNLIDNAIRYSGPNSQITVQLINTEETIVVIIKDTGIRIPETVKAKIFENFYRANVQTSEGAGLGMSIIKDIVDLHNGSLKINEGISSKGERGNSFTVVFPK